MTIEVKYADYWPVPICVVVEGYCNHADVFENRSGMWCERCGAEWNPLDNAWMEPELGVIWDTDV